MPPTENYPWTDAQIEFALAAALAYIELDRDDVREILRGLTEAGVKVEVPTFRYAAMQSPGATWLVVDCHATNNAYDDPTTVASFHAAHGSKVGHPDPQAGAIAEAARLNAAHARTPVEEHDMNINPCHHTLVQGVGDGLTQSFTCVLDDGHWVPHQDDEGREWPQQACDTDLHETLRPVLRLEGDGVGLKECCAACAGDLVVWLHHRARART